VVPSAILAILIHPFTTHWRLVRIVWAFSLYLEAVSVLPQLRFMQNAKVGSLDCSGIYIILKVYVVNLALFVDG